MKHLFRQIIIFCLFAAGLFILFAPERALAYRTAPLPGGNLIVNPWFRSSADPNLPGADGWEFVPTLNEITWGVTQQGNIPSPEVQISESCGSLKVYCGTAARWTQTSRNGIAQSYPGVDTYIYQVVATDPGHRRLEYAMHWVNLKVEIFEVNIYGGSAPDGPWDSVWQVISVTQDENPPAGQGPGTQNIPWYTTGVRDTILTQGYPYYKVELHARYPVPESDHGDVGVMVTGIYFSTELTEEPDRLSTPALVYNPTANAPGSNAAAAPSTSPTTSGIEPESDLPTLELTALPTVAEDAPEEGSGNGVLLGLLTGVLMIGIFLIIRAVSARTQ